MEDSPAQTIVYDPLPDSPIQIQYNEDDNVEELFVPQRKRRRNGTRKTKPDIRVQGQPPEYQFTNTNAQSIDTYLGEVALLNTHPDPTSSTIEEVQVGADMDIYMDQVVQRDSEDEFLYFLDAVLTEECAMLRLTDHLFVTNGWNISKREPTV